jgi:hypothetical protein
VKNMLYLVPAIIATALLWATLNMDKLKEW